MNRRIWLPVFLMAFVQLSLHAAETLTNAEVVTLSERDVPAAVIVAKIAASRTDFDTSVQQLLALTEAGVAAEVLAAMAEWEYAARAGTTTKYFFGDTVTPAQANKESRKKGRYTRYDSLLGKVERQRYLNLYSTTSFSCLANRGY